MSSAKHNKVFQFEEADNLLLCSIDFLFCYWYNEIMVYRSNARSRVAVSKALPNLQDVYRVVFLIGSRQTLNAAVW